MRTIRPDVRWRPGVFVASDLLELVIINNHVEFAGFVVNYTDRLLSTLKRKCPR